ncbi:DUF1488 family protein [Oceanibaculum nanhaiense]|uniref:DUF1488 family protein n=1 Tax=Oceanibaculum nanhaiense TaxID=1909734 RepID=UPI00396D572D
MTISFPNPSRSFDVNLNGVRFVGHDGVFEIPFIVMASALTRALTGAPTGPGQDSEEAVAGETEYLAGFDALRDAIQNAARTAYSRSDARRTLHTLTGADVARA